MTSERVEMIAPCGLDCSKCDMYRAKSEPQIMQSVLDWFKTERKIDLKPEQVEFPCERIESWASHRPEYAAALERLKGMKNAK